jgi:hypothetical protein
VVEDGRVTFAQNSVPAPLPIYLGPTLPRWQPRSVADVQAAIDDGTLGERHWLDVKETVGSSDGAKKELARDLASFANDGGGLIIGVAEDKAAGALALAPIELAGFAERIDQVVRSRCDPPLYVQCHPLADPANAAHGVLLVEVPPSPLAPHMVEGIYYGRNDKTKHKLTDAEVANLHARRAARQLTGEQVIAREVARSPIARADQKLSHLFVVAQPLTSPPDLLTPLIGDERQLRALINEANKSVPGSDQFSPHLGFVMSDCEPRPRGAGFHSYAIVGRRFQPHMKPAREESQLDVEVWDDGTVVLFCGGASLIHYHGIPEDVRQYIHGIAVVALTRVTLAIAAKLGSTAGYAGRWLLAVGINNLQGRFAGYALGRPGVEFPSYSEDDYVQATESMTTELLAQPGAVTARLIHRLLRALRDPAAGYSQWFDRSDQAH